MKIRLKISCEIETDEELSEELQHSMQMSTSLMVEQLEARWADALREVQKKHPELKFRFVRGCDE